MVRNEESIGDGCAQPSYKHPTDQGSLGAVSSGCELGITLTGIVTSSG